MIEPGEKINKRKGKRSDIVQIPKSKVTTQKRHKKIRLHNDCGPT